MNLESRARRAAASLHAGVAGVTAPAGGPAPTPRRLIWGLALGGAAAVALLVVALLVLPSGGDPQTVAGGDLSTTTAAAGTTGLDGSATLPPTTTAPSGGLPDGGGTTRPITPTTIPAATTTTTTAAGGDTQGGDLPPGPNDNNGGEHSDLLPDFWAAQAYGCSAEPEPRELFYGAGEPGETITLDSPYGAATVVVGDDGYWEAGVAFAGAAYDEPFSVTVTNGDGESWEMGFVIVDPVTGECAPPVEYWFSAYQVWGCSIEQPPSELFYGDGVPGDTIALASPYGSAMTVVDEWGWWETTLTFDGAPVGETFAVTATSGTGEVWELYFTAADPETGECVPPMEYWFSAYQGSGCSMEAPPTEWFYGTGFPGDVIRLESPYGSAEALVDEWGWWEATLAFDGAPYDETFEVTVAAPDGEVWAFPFTAPDPETGSCWLFTAYQGAGCSVEQPPAEWFWGTGTPGDLIELASPYGSAEAVVDEWGYWEAALIFEGAPVGEAFTIEVAAPDGTIWDFPFIVGDPEDGTCGGWVEPCPPDGCDGGPAPWPVPGDQSPAYLESVEFLSTNATPAGVSVVITGSLPTPCHTLGWDLYADEDKMALEVYSYAAPAGACAQVLVPFTEVIDLGEFAPGTYVLWVNGREYTFEV